MNVSKSKNANVELFACLVDDTPGNPMDVDDDYRFLVDGKYVKYVTTAPGTFAASVIDRTFGPIVVGELFPPFPVGNWNRGHVAKDPETGEVAFIKTEMVDLPGVENVWHPVKLKESDFTLQDRLRQRVRIATHPELNNGKPVLLKTAIWPYEIDNVEAETTAYEWIRDSGVGPKFLGHTTGDDGRVVGFVVEYVQDARNAGPEDLEGCRKALGQLHALGIKLGDTNKYNFLVREGHDVVIIDFETATKCSPQELEDEMNALKGCLEDKSFRGGVQVLVD